MDTDPNLLREARTAARQAATAVARSAVSGQKRSGYGILVAAVFSVFTVVLSVLLAHHTVNESNVRMCAVAVTMDDQLSEIVRLYPAQSPETMRRNAASWAKLRHDLQCPARA